MNPLPAISEVEIERLNVYGAREHNLKNIDASLPRNQFIVITGISGSGKSSLAFDTIYAEGQRRYLESFSSYARQFVGNMERPDVDQISGLSPVIAIEQKTTSKNPRSTVGTVTEIYDFMRLLYARAAEAYSQVTGKKMQRYTEAQILDHISRHFQNKRIIVLAPLVRSRKGHYRELFEKVRKQGYLKVRVDGDIMDIEPRMQVDRYKIHDIELVVDRLAVDHRTGDRLRESLQTALRMGNDNLLLIDHDTGKSFPFSKQLVDADSGISYEDPSPNSFSFNSPYGACPRCNGLGVIKEVDIASVISNPKLNINEGGLAPLGELKDNYTFRELRKIAQRYGFTLATPMADIPPKALHVILHGHEEGPGQASEYAASRKGRSWRHQFEGLINMLQRCYHETGSDHLRKWAETYMITTTCPGCAGARLKKEALHFKIADTNISALTRLDITQLKQWFDTLKPRLTQRQKAIGKDVIKEISDRLQFLLDVGLNYLTLDRPARTLSGGESQRIRLATQIGSQLVGITYILDEPSIGLHQRDNARLITSLRQLRDMGNTVIVVEHDKQLMDESDFILDLGPGAGDHGGRIVGQGPPAAFRQLNSLTAKYLRGAEKIALPGQRRRGNGYVISLKGARGHNLKNVRLDLPLGKVICVTGVSGSGKSSLITETLYPILRHALHRAHQKPLPYAAIEGMEHIDKVIEIDQAPIGRTPRSNPVTYIGVFSDIRQLFAKVPEARVRGYKPGRFSFNVKGGRCPECEGAGMKVIEMNFLPDVHVHCEKCLGRRFNRETLEVRYKGKSISDVLEMRIEEAVVFFEKIPKIHGKLKTLHDVGLDYIALGQPATTLSGGEAQRVKLAAELCKKDTGNTFYILDEPTTGLHFEDIRMLLEVLCRLVDKGNTVLIIEHNLEVIKVADHIIDLGPEGGAAGGEIIAQGAPEAIIGSKRSHTAHFLKAEL